MEAAATRELGGDKAQRIIDAMRSSVGLRGAAGATFDHVAREAGVSRGLLHYYFGTKERLLVEVARRDCEIRMALLDEAFAAATTADELIGALVRSLRQMVDDDPGFIALIFELFTVSRHNDEMAAEFRDLLHRTRERVAGLLAAKRDEGVVELAAEPAAIANVLYSLGDGLALRMLSEPDFDFSATIDAAAAAARALIRPR